MRAEKEEKPYAGGSGEYPTGYSSFVGFGRMVRYTTAATKKLKLSFRGRVCFGRLVALVGIKTAIWPREGTLGHNTRLSKHLNSLTLYFKYNEYLCRGKFDQGYLQFSSAEKKTCEKGSVRLEGFALVLCGEDLK